MIDMRLFCAGLRRSDSSLSIGPQLDDLIITAFYYSRITTFLVIDQIFKLINLLDDCGYTCGESGVFNVGTELFLEALGRKLNWRKRVFYFVGDSPGNFAPSRGSLGIYEHGEIIEYQYHAEIVALFVSKHGKRHLHLQRLSANTEYT